MNAITYEVPEMSCRHCGETISEELTLVAGVDRVAIDLAGKQVVVYGSALDDRLLRVAIENAGYEAR